MSAGRKYTAAEDAVVLADMRAGLHENVTAAKLGRTACAIHIRQCKLRAQGAPGVAKPQQRKSRSGEHSKPGPNRQRLPRRKCNTCPNSFQPRSTQERFCESCRRGVVHDAGWSFAL